MLKRILILLLCLTFKPFLNAQESFEPSTHIGIHGGVNLSTVSLKPEIKQGFITSREFGIVFRQISEPHIGLQVEVNLAGKGWKEIIDSVGTYTRRLETVDIPVMAVFVAGSRRLRFAFTIGPYVSYLRKEKEIINIPEKPFYNSLTGHKFLYNSRVSGSTEKPFSEAIEIVETPFSRDHYLQPLVRNWEFGFTGGAAVEVHTKIGGFAVRASYSHALTNLFPLNIDKYYFSGSRNQKIHVGFMYLVNL
jgi:hypothetical protein